MVGRLENCDVVMEHPSLSRYHAVVQYKADPEADKEDVGGKGFYLYDLRYKYRTILVKDYIMLADP